LTKKSCNSYATLASYLHVYYYVYRCGIPVVIMGETGCGKTRLIRYMCDLAKSNRKERTNMIILKVNTIL
jgi:ABC-type lipoprotein export system ATPase subunit